MRSRHLAQERHLECLFHLFATWVSIRMPRCRMILFVPYTSLQQHFRSRIGRIPSTMTEKDRKEVLPLDMPEPRGKGHVICCSIDAYVLVIR